MVENIRGGTYEEQVMYVMNPENLTLRCPSCNKMNLTDSQYCGFCGCPIGQRTIEAIRKNKMNLIIVALESDEKLFNECFTLVLKRIIDIERVSKSDKGITNPSENKLEHAKKRGRKPKNSQ